MKSKYSVFVLWSCFAEGFGGTMSRIEVSITPGLPTFDVIGLCDSSIRESRGRIKSAMVSSGFFMPRGHITVSITPAYLKKSGSSFDLPICLGILFASGQLPIDAGASVYAEGELTLKGEIKGTPGAPVRFMSIDREFDYKIVPDDERVPLGCTGVSAVPVGMLDDVGRLFIDRDYHPGTFDSEIRILRENCPDISILKGQEKTARALTIAAAGFHNILMLGSPGCGKTLAGKILAGLLPSPILGEAREIYAVSEMSGDIKDQDEICIGIKRPFRVIHPGMTASFINGSSKTNFPGQIALSNRGILFADEITEFTPGVLESLRIPLEEHEVKIVRDGTVFSFPTNFLFAGAGNPCKCGMLYEEGKRCTCTPAIIRRYAAKLSGPLTDRIDLFTEMRSIEKEQLERITDGENGGGSSVIREKIGKVWEIQRERYREFGEGLFNGNTELLSRDILRMEGDVTAYASELASEAGMSARGFSKLLRVGRTIADLEGRADMTKRDIAEAFTYKRR